MSALIDNAAHDLESFVGRQRDLGHDLDVDMQGYRLGAVHVQVLGIVDMQLRFGQRMQPMFLYRFRHL